MAIILKYMRIIMVQKNNPSLLDSSSSRPELDYVCTVVRTVSTRFGYCLPVSAGANCVTIVL